MADAAHYYGKVSAWAILNDERIPIDSFRIEYKLNAVPTALINVPIGREAKGALTGEVSSAQGILSLIAPFQPVQIYFRIDADGPIAPPGKSAGVDVNTDILVFEGYVSQPGANKISPTGPASLAIGCVGMASALGGSTAMVRGMYVPKAADGTFGDYVIMSLKSNQVSLTSIDALIKNSTLEELRNIKDSILNIFTQIADMVSAWGSSGNAGINDFCKTELERIAAETTLDAPNLALLQDVEATEEEFRKGLAAYYASRLWNDWLAFDTKTLEVKIGNKEEELNAKSLWETLLEYSRDFRFTFVPAIEGDALVPLTLGLGGEPWGEPIDPSEYWEIELSQDPSITGTDWYAYTTRVLIAGKCVHSTFDNKPMPVGKRMGYAEVDISEGDTESVPKGKLLTVDAPNYALFPGSPLANTGAGWKKSADGFKPAAGDEKVDEATLKYSTTICNALAASILYDVLFSPRKGRVRGRFRLDIAPGSLLQINTVGERFSGEADTLYGHAESVVLYCGEGSDGSSGAVWTEFTLTNVRSEDEHSSYTTPQHPLYETMWVGGKLSDKSGE